VRVLILHSRYLSGAASGENRVVDDEASLLERGGHDVRVWSPSPIDAGLGSRVRAGVDAIWSRRAASRVRALIEDHRPDIVHFHNLFPMLSPAAVRVAAATTPTVMTLHNYRLLCLPATFLRDGKVCELCLGHATWAGVRYRCYRGSALGSASLAISLEAHRVVRSLSGVRRFLAVSEFIKTKHVEGRMPAGKVIVKPNFSWPAPRRAGAGDDFLYLGRLSPEKGVSTLLAAWNPSFGRLVVAGDGPRSAELRRGAAGNVEFIGPVDEGDVPALLARARALLLPSVWYEGSPRSIIEAYAAGVPVVASKIGSLEEAVDHDVTGLLIPPRDAERWGAALERLRDDDESIRMGSAALELWARRHSPDRGLERLESAYREAIASGS
jgi:glycosyltransferase involved in cell wall biosynthesis